MTVRAVSAVRGHDRSVVGRGRRRGQTTLEFALVAPLFLACFFGAVDAALWAVQSGAAVSAAEQAARLAAAASGSPTSTTTPTSEQLVDGVRAQLEPALFGTRVVAWCSAGRGACVPGTGGCPSTPADVEAAFGPRTVAVCEVQGTAAPACPAPPLAPTPRCGDPPTVTVHVIGYLASLVPPISGFAWR